MRKLENILVGVDFSPGSKAALQQATRLAEENDARLVVFHVIPKLVATDISAALGRDAAGLETEMLEDARAQLDEFIGDDAQRDGLAREATVGSAIKETLAAVERYNADLLVLGVTGAGSNSVGAGTFATKCVRRAPCRVLLVHDDHGDAFDHVVACVDFSDTSVRALEQAAQVAGLYDASLTALHVYFGPWNVLHYRAPTPEANPAFKRQYMSRLQSLLVDSVAPLRTEYPDVEFHTELHEHSSYGRGVVEYAKQHDADLVVLGTEGNTNLRYMFLGSTAERVLRETPCSVLSIKPLQFSPAEAEA